MSWNHVDGENKGKVVLYALSTCEWCKEDQITFGRFKSGL